MVKWISGVDADKGRREAAIEIARRCGASNRAGDVEDLLVRWGETATSPRRAGQTPDPRVVVLQLAAHDVFGGSLTHLSRLTNLPEVQALQKTDGKFYEDVVSAMHEYSQQQLAAHGIENMTLWRAMAAPLVPSLTKAESGFYEYDPQLQPISSFTYNAKTAIRFSGAPVGGVVIAHVPARRLIGTAATGFGVLSQKELVISGHKESSGDASSSPDRAYLALWQNQNAVDALRKNPIEHWAAQIKSFESEDKERKILRGEVTKMSETTEVETTAKAAKITVFGTNDSNGLAHGIIEGGEGVDGNWENANWMRQDVEPPASDEDVDD